MRILFLFLLGLITFQVNAQTKIIGSSRTLAGDLEGDLPNAYIKQNTVNRANLTQGLRDSLTRFREDTIIKVRDATLNLNSSINQLGKYSRVYVNIDNTVSQSSMVILPFAEDTIRNTEFYFRMDMEDDDTTASTIRAFDGFVIGYDGVGYVTDTDVPFRSREWMRAHTFEDDGVWYWEYTRLPASRLHDISTSGGGITELTGAVTASGTGSVVTTLSDNTVTSAKIVNSTIVSADIASQTVDSLDIKNGAITTVKIQADAVTSSRVQDNSLTGSDLTYLTLRAGTTSNASLQLTSGSDKTTLTGGEIMYNGSRVAVGIGSNKRRVAVTNDVAPSNGYLPIGNGTDFTNAALTAGYAQTITNASGSITLTNDTTKLIPFIPNAEIGNGTRNGYFWNRTSGIFGHQFYRGGYGIFNNTITSASTAATGLTVSKSGSTSRVTANMTGTSPYVDINASTGVTGEAGLATVSTKGLSVRALNTDIGTNLPSGATFVVDGATSLEYVTDNSVTAITLPEVIDIAVTSTRAVNKVAPGFRLTVVLDTGAGVTFNAGGSDVIYTNGSTGFASNFSTSGAQIRVVELIAVAVGTWVRVY